MSDHDPDWPQKWPQRMYDAFPTLSPHGRSAKEWRSLYQTVPPGDVLSEADRRMLANGVTLSDGKRYRLVEDAG